MEEPLKLAEMLLAHVRDHRAQPEDVTALALTLDRAMEAARAQWEGVDVPAELFMRYIAERLSKAEPERAFASVVERLHLRDLYLACACVRGDVVALARFEKHCLSKLPVMIGHLRLSSAALDDVCEKTRVVLLVGRDKGNGPKLHTYGGRCPLASWVATVAINIALEPLKESDSRMMSWSDEEVRRVMEDVPAAWGNPENRLSREHEEAAVHEAVRRAIASLPDDDRLWFQLYFRDGLSEAAIGKIAKKNQSTIARRLKDARMRIYKQAKRSLRERLGYSTESILAMLDSQFELHISQIFAAKNEPGT